MVLRGKRKLLLVTELADSLCRMVLNVTIYSMITAQNSTLGNITTVASYTVTSAQRE